MPGWRGYSLIEFIASLLILVILAGYSIGSFAVFIDDSRSHSALQELAQAIRLARANAISHRRYTTICRSADGLTCSGTWTQGAIVFSDANGNHLPDAEDQLLAQLRFTALAGEISWHAFQNRQWLQLTPEGITRYQNGNFTYCPFDGDATRIRQLVVSRTARLRFATDNDGDGVVEDSQGKPVDCRS